MALSDFFGRTGSVRDLGRAEECLRESLAGTDARSPERPAQFAHLASVLTDRYGHEGRDALEEAVALYTEAEHAAPPGSPEHAAHNSGLGTVYLDQWGTSLRLSARRLDDAAEALRAVGLHERAVALTRDGSPDLPLRRGNLAAALRLHTDLAGDRASLERSVEVHEQARRTVGEESPYPAAVLTNHAAALRASAQRTGQRAPLDEAIGMLRLALRVTAPDAPERAGRLVELGQALADSGQSGDAAEAVRAYREGCRLADPDNAPVRLVAGRAWSAWATRREAHEEAAEAFDHAVDAVDLLVRTQLTRPAAEIWLARATEVAAEAAHAHAASGASAGRPAPRTRQGSPPDHRTAHRRHRSAAAARHRPRPGRPLPARSGPAARPRPGHGSSPPTP
ncbi:hypothetical protein AB0M89_27370 [Streptomyces microflavus]|uniref:hypothetical protein n=1 Tax=Streptomyces microflavus TaxID=1919 RepID=UPI003437C5FD